MNISFPIDNFSQTYNILSELFELEINTKSESFTFIWENNTITCIKTKSGKKSNLTQVIHMELFHLQRSFIEMEKRIEFYCYKNHITIKNLGIVLDKKNHSFIWKISSAVKIEIFFSSELGIGLSEINN